MIISRLKLTNFAVFEDREFTFTSGVNTILGRNGSGKSTILTAISIILFNHAPLPLNRLIRLGTRYAEIQLEFLHEGVTYEVTRGFGSSSKCIVKKNGKEEMNKLADFQKFLVDLFGQNLASIRESLYLSSSDLTYIFKAEPARRRVIIESMLGLDEYEKTFNLLKEPLADLQKRLNTLNSQRISIEAKLSILKDNDYNSLDEESKLLLVKQDQLEIRRKQILEGIYKRINRYDKALENINLKISEIPKNRLDKIENICYNIETLTKQFHQTGRYICPTCLQDLSWNDMSAIQEELQEQIFSLKYQAVNELSTLDNEDLEQQELNKNKKELVTLKVEEEQKLKSKEFLELEQELNKVKTELLKKQVTLEMIRKSIKESRELEESLQSLLISISEVEDQIKSLTFYREGFRQIGPYMSTLYVAEISANASYILSTIMDKQNQVFVDNEYSIEVDTIEKGLRIFQQLSEGEKAMVSIAVRLAMARLTRFNLIFLDEVTANLDTTSKTLFSDNIVNLGFNQIFIITHDGAFSEYAQNIIRV